MEIVTEINKNHHVHYKRGYKAVNAGQYSHTPYGADKKDQVDGKKSKHRSLLFSAITYKEWKETGAIFSQFMNTLLRLD